MLALHELDLSIVTQLNYFVKHPWHKTGGKLDQSVKEFVAHIKLNPGTTIRELSKSFHMDATSVASRTKLAVEQGLVKKRGLRPMKFYVSSAPIAEDEK